MKLFVTASFKGNDNKKKIEHLCKLVKMAGFEDFCFIRDVEHYTKMFNDSHKLMQRAKDEIIQSDALLIDMTDKPTGGAAIEAGVAFALNKKVIVIAKKGTPIKNTTSGIASLVVEYDVIDDIVIPLREWLSKI